MTEPVPVERPKPLTSLAMWVGPVVGLVGALFGFLVPLGLLSEAEAGQLSELWAVVVSGVLPAISTTAGVFVHARLGRDRVTPMSDPRDVDGVALVRADDGATVRPLFLAPGPRGEPNGAADHARHSRTEEP